MQRPLATVVIGGIVTSTLLTLLLLPSLYRWLVGDNNEGAGYRMCRSVGGDGPTIVTD